MIISTTLVALSLLSSFVLIPADVNSDTKSAWAVPPGYTSIIDFENVNYQKVTDYGDYSSYSYDYNLAVDSAYNSPNGSNMNTDLTFDSYIGFRANYVLDEDLADIGGGNYSTGGFPIVANANATYGRGDLYPWDPNFTTNTMAFLVFDNNSPFNYSLAFTFRDIITGTSSYTGSWQYNAENLGSELHIARAYSTSVSSDKYTCSPYSTTYIWFCIYYGGLPSFSLSGVSLFCNNTTGQFINGQAETFAKIDETAYNGGQEYATSLINEPNAIIDLFETIAGFIVNSFLAVALIPCFGSNLLTIFLILLGIVLIIWILKVVRG